MPPPVWSTIYLLLQKVTKFSTDFTVQNGGLSRQCCRRSPGSRSRRSSSTRTTSSRRSGPVLCHNTNCMGRSRKLPFFNRLSVPHRCNPPGAFKCPSAFVHSKPVLYGAFVSARRGLNIPKRRFPARAVHRPAAVARRRRAGAARHRGASPARAQWRLVAGWQVLSYMAHRDECFRCSDHRPVRCAPPQLCSTVRRPRPSLITRCHRRVNCHRR